jgi:small subunit ribosomal protein S21
LRNNRQSKYNSKPQVDGLKVEVRNGDFNGALRRFKKKVQEAGIIQEIRERQFYTKPSLKRAKAKAAGRARWLKKQRKQQEEWS